MNRWRRRRRRRRRLVENALVAHLHLHFGEGDPFVLQTVVPSQSQGVFAVDVDVLTVRIPPTALVTIGAVGVAQILVVVSGAELHRLVVRRHGVRRVARVAVELDREAFVLAADQETVVFRPPVLAVNVPQVDAQHRRVVFRQPVEVVVAQPEFSEDGTETCATVHVRHQKRNKNNIPSQLPDL